MEINHMTFKKSFRGYNVDAVDEFKNNMKSSVEDLNRENSDLKRKLEAVSERLKAFEEVQASIHESLILAQETASEVKATASKEADIIVKEAKSDALEIMNKATNQAQSIDENTEYVRQESRVFYRKLEMMLEAQLNLVKSQNVDQELFSQQIPEGELEAIVAPEDL